MSTRKYNVFNKKACCAFLLLSFLIFLIYSNTFHASWHFDDYTNIINDANICIKVIDIKSVHRSFFRANGGKISRPLSRLTFAVNWYFSRYDVTGYHIVNTVIHLLTAWILYFTILTLFRSPAMKDRNQGSEHFIALLATVLWAINPIQTQAVTNIVQRMASMAAMFYLLSLFLYIKGRTINSRLKRSFFFFGCFISFLLGLASKENVTILPIALVLVEMTFFQDLSQTKTKRNMFWITVGGGIFVIICGYLLFLSGNPFSAILEGYENRFFSPIQRLMTEPRVILFYLSQIFYPVPTRLSIEHDVTISTSLFNPWTTLPGIAFVLALIGLGLWKIRKMPMLSFAILFFFLNHSIESTVFNLELLFEHRNYLPSFFIFVPISIGIKRMLDYYRHEKRPMFYAIVLFIILLLVGIASGTYIRNMAWATEKSLWEDANKKAPGMMRPVHNLALTYERSGQSNTALKLYAKALTLTMHQTIHEAMPYNNMAAMCYWRGKYKKAVELWKKAFDVYPDFEGYEHRLALALTKLGEWEKASRHLDAVLVKRPDYPDFLELKGIVLLNQNRPLEAVVYFGKWLRLYPGHSQALRHVGLAFSCVKEYQRAELFLKRAHVLDLKSISILFSLINVNLKIGDKEDVDLYVNKLFSSASSNLIESSLKKLIEDDVALPVSQHMLIREIARKLDEKSREIAKLGKHSRGQCKNDK